MLDLNDIRARVQARLMGETDAGNNVLDSEIPPIEDGELPCIDIFTPSELVQDDLIVYTLEVWIITEARAGENIGILASALVTDVMRLLSKGFWHEIPDAPPVTFRGRDTDYNVDAIRPHATTKLIYEIETLYE